MRVATVKEGGRCRVASEHGYVKESHRLLLLLEVSMQERMSEPFVTMTRYLFQKQVLSSCRSFHTGRAVRVSAFSGCATEHACMPVLDECRVPEWGRLQVSSSGDDGGILRFGRQHGILRNPRKQLIAAPAYAILPEAAGEGCRADQIPP